MCDSLTSFHFSWLNINRADSILYAFPITIMQSFDIFSKIGGSMKVRVYAPFIFCDSNVVDDDGFMELPEGAILKDVYKELKITPMLRRLFFCNVNYKRVKMSQKLKDQDVISFFSAITGG